MAIFGITPERIALGKMSYGPRPAEVAAVSGGPTAFAEFVEAQLAAPAADEPVIQALIANATLPIQYTASPTYPAVNEQRRLTVLAETDADLWKRVSGGDAIAPQEYLFPPQAVRAATWIRAVHSSYGLKEMMVEFWHNHFNVACFQSREILAMFPAYDRIMRANWNGNFRTFLEAVATSACMGYYLNNVLSRATQPNENYARELMELHTLGRENYFDHQYATWDQVPGALQGTPAGFIDDDVFGAARAFSGWTISTGQRIGTRTLANDGSFVYVPEYHSGAVARVLGVRLDTLTQPMAAGRKVLDLVAAHPATARYVCTKIIRRLVSDTPPASLVDKAVATFIKAAAAPDQIAQVLRTILMSPEVRSPELASAKFRRPYERVVAMMRMIGVAVQPNLNLFNSVSGTGYTQFNWSPPTGHPDTPDYWLNSNATLRTWNILLSLFSGSAPPVVGILQSQGPAISAGGLSILSYWYDRLVGGQSTQFGGHGVFGNDSALINDAGAPGGVLYAVSGGNPQEVETALRRFVALVAAGDEFSYR